jgi:hypothetical protein
VNTFSRGTIFSSEVMKQNMIAMEKNKHQRQPGPPERRSSRPGRQEQTNKGRPERRSEPSASQDPDQNANAATGHTKPITNQDEQRRATNAGNANDVMGEQETEGDRWRNNRSRPYINSDDFINIQRKTPTME